MTNTGGLVDTHHDEERRTTRWSDPGHEDGAACLGHSEDDTDQPTVDIVDVETGEVVDTFDLDLPESPAGVCRHSSR